MASHITISKAEGTWVVRAGGAVLAESQNALALNEGAYGPVIYFPREDIAMAFLDVSDRTSYCPHKGDASYFNIVNTQAIINTLTDRSSQDRKGIEIRSDFSVNTDVLDFFGFYKGISRDGATVGSVGVGAAYRFN